ncbi:hypothetical protein FRC17_001614 [Serendipita sp. 399]|nr:hypothetical protein FRC17_001614 [Serendipita sp. 399]
MRTGIAIRIGLGDGQGPDESDILVFGQLPTSEVPDQPGVLQLLAGRIAPPPTAPSPNRRIARPDDPLPRPHPLANLHLSPGRRGLKRKRSSTNNPFADQGLLEKDNSVGSSKGAGGLPGSALMAALAEAQAQSEKKKKGGKVVVDEKEQKGKGLVGRPSLFRVGSTSKKNVDKAKGQSLDGDGFVIPGPPIRSLPTKSKGKEQEGDNLGSVPEQGQNGTTETELETKNKTAIKKRTLAALEACGISKIHSHFKDMYGWIHRGVAFAVRSIIKDTKVDRDLISKLIEVHLEMYFGGRGGKFNVEAVGSGSNDRAANQSMGNPQHEPVGLKIIMPVDSQPSALDEPLSSATDGYLNLDSATMYEDIIPEFPSDSGHGEQ